MKSALCKHLEDLSGLAEAELKQVGLHPVQCLQWRVGVLAMGFEKGPAPVPRGVPHFPWGNLGSGDHTLILVDCPLV